MISINKGFLWHLCVSLTQLSLPVFHYVFILLFVSFLLLFFLVIGAAISDRCGVSII